MVQQHKRKPSASRIDREARRGRGRFRILSWMEVGGGGGGGGGGRFREDNGWVQIKGQQ